MKTHTTLLRFLLIGCFYCAHTTTKAQISQPATLDPKIFIQHNAAEVKYASHTTIPYYVRFKTGSCDKLTAHTLLQKMTEQPAAFSLKETSRETDELGITHIRYVQQYQQIPVLGGDYILHCKGDQVLSMNGNLYPNIEYTPALISTTEALQAAMNFMPATSYKWQLPQEEQFLKEIKNDAQATYYPKASMYLIPENGQFDAANAKMVLAYQFDIFSHEPLDRKDVFVNSANGRIEYFNQTLQHIAAVGKAVTGYSDTQTINTDSISPTSFILLDRTRGSGIQTYNANNATNFPANNFTDNDNFWNNVNAKLDHYATDAHFAAEKTYDYFLSIFNRNSINNSGYKLNSFVHHGTNFDNAAWTGTLMYYGDGSNGKPFTTVDIGGHEISHGLTTFTSNLVYSYESGALNESFSDIFGIAVDFYARPDKANWLMGDDRGVTIRSMSNPKSFNNPDTYKGQYWVTGTVDNGGVHTNSGVQNYWYYLLAVGDTGTNDNGDAYAVSGIGIDSAAKIAYRTNAFYLTRNSQFADARFFSIKSATDLYGACSKAVIQTVNAWHAVGVGKKINPDFSTDFAVLNNKDCKVPVNFKLTTPTYLVNAGWQLNNNAIIYGDPFSIEIKDFGKYSVTLYADNGCRIDTIKKNAYLEVIQPDGPAGISKQRPDPGTLTLEASADSAEIVWYEDTTNQKVIFSGVNFTTPTLAQTKTYYASAVYPGNTYAVGPASNTFGAGTNITTTSTTNYLEFNCYKPCILSSVKVYSTRGDTKLIQLRDSNNVIIDELSVEMPVGEGDIQLDFKLPVANKMRLGIPSTTVPNLYRNSTNIKFPYEIPGVLSIVRSGNTTNPLGFYPYFYNWVINEYPCVSKKTPVKAQIGLSDLSTPEETKHLLVYPNPNRGIFSIETDRKDLTILEIIDLGGRKLYSQNIIDTAPLQIKLDQLQHGIYTIKLSNGQEQLIEKLIISE